MEELEQNLENLDELRKQAKDYANTLVLPNDERLNSEDRENNERRQAELLQQRDEQEAKLIEEIQREEVAKEKPIYIPSSERYNKTESQKLREVKIEEELQERKIELSRINDEQEARWKMQSQNSLIGKISKKVKSKLNGNQERKQELLKSDFLEEVAKAAQEADLKLAEINPKQDVTQVVESQNATFEQDKLLINVPNTTLEQIKNEELLFSMEKENNKTKTLKPNNKGSIFSSILIILTTLTVGIIIALTLLR